MPWTAPSEAVVAHRLLSSISTGTVGLSKPQVVIGTKVDHSFLLICIPVECKMHRYKT